MSLDEARKRAARRGRPGAAESRPAQPGETRTYRVADCDGNGGTLFKPVVITVTVPAACPHPTGDGTCGIARGVGYPEQITFHPDRATKYDVHRWSNPCGHIDFTADVIREATRFGDIRAAS